MGISSKIKVIMQLEFELASFRGAIQYFSNDTTGNPFMLKNRHTYTQLYDLISR